VKFSEVAKGTRAERRTTLRVRDTEVAVLLRPLSALEETEVTASAIRFAKQRGGETAPGASLYDTGHMVHALSLGVIDPDSPPEARTPFFDGGVDQILSSLDTDSIAVLYQQYRLWQEQTSPSYEAASAVRLYELSKEFGRDDDDPKVLSRYLALSLTTRLSLLRFMAVLLHKSPERSSSHSSISDDAEEKTKSDTPSQRHPSRPEDSH